MAVLARELIQLKFYMVIGMDVKLPYVNLIWCFIAVQGSYWPFYLRFSGLSKSPISQLLGILTFCYGSQQ